MVKPIQAVNMILKYNNHQIKIIEMIPFLFIHLFSNQDIQLPLKIQEREKTISTSGPPSTTVRFTLTETAVSIDSGTSCVLRCAYY